MNILLIDDESTFSDVLARSLERKGFQVQTASNIKTAIKQLKEKEFDCAVVDLRIGEESGLALVKLIKAEYSHIRVIMLTGYASITTAVEAIKLGATHYLTKPADVDDVIAAFDKNEGDVAVKAAEIPLSAQRMEWEFIQKILHQHDGNISAAARAMGMHRRTLQRKLQKRPSKL